MSIPPALLTTEVAARHLSVGRTKIYALIRSGILPSIRVGGLRRIPLDALDALVADLVNVDNISRNP